MDPFNTARMIAMNTPQGSPEYQLACAVCMTRTGDAFSSNMAAGMANWQAVIMETALLGMLLARLGEKMA